MWGGRTPPASNAARSGAEAYAPVFLTTSALSADPGGPATMAYTSTEHHASGPHRHHRSHVDLIGQGQKYLTTHHNASDKDGVVMMSPGVAPWGGMPVTSQFPWTTLSDHGRTSGDSSFHASSESDGLSSHEYYCELSAHAHAAYRGGGAPAPPASSVRSKTMVEQPQSDDKGAGPAVMQHEVKPGPMQYNGSHSAHVQDNQHGGEASPASDKVHDVLKGDVADRFKTLKLLHRSAVTEVWACHDKLHDKNVALKMVTAPDRQEAAELKQEAGILTVLRHNSILTLLEFHTNDDGISRMVMELADTTLLDALVGDACELDEAILRDLMQQAADALEYVHGNGLVHGDVKPDNMLLIGRQLKLADFGLTTQHKTTRKGAPRGTKPYMAPELIRLGMHIAEGKVDANDVEYTVDYSSDVWSFAIVLYSVLLWDLPWEMASVYDDSYNWFVNDMAKRQREPWVLLTEPLFAMLMAMLSPDPAERPMMRDIAASISLPWLLSSEEPEPEGSPPVDDTPMAEPFLGHAMPHAHAMLDPHGAAGVVPDPMAAWLAYGSSASQAVFGEPNRQALPYAYCYVTPDGVEWDASEEQKQ